MKISGLILAAGKSERMGTYKMTLPFGKKTVLESALLSLYSSCDEIKVVTGYNHTIIEDLLVHYDKVSLVHNNLFEKGMFSSVQCGLRNVSGDKVILLPGDIPGVSPSTVEMLKQVIHPIVIPSYNGKKGHPVIIERRHFNYLIDASDEMNLKKCIDVLGFTTVEIDDPFILRDLDTPEDYNFIKKL